MLLDYGPHFTEIKCASYGNGDQMKLMNYMNLNIHPVQLSFRRDRTHEFAEVYHAHQGMELLFVHSGGGTIIVEQQILALAPGSLYCFKPFQLHRIRLQLAPGEPYIRSLFVFEPAVLSAALAPFASLRGFFDRLWKDPLAPPSLAPMPGEAMELLLRLHEPRLKTAAGERLLEEQLLFLTAFLHGCRAAAEASADPGVRPPSPLREPSAVAERAMAWIETHYMEPFRLEALARDVHLSPNHVSATFRRAVGSSLTEYLTARRVRQACWLLQTTDLGVQQIGQSVGLDNFSYFCQMFKKHVGVTPHRFRASARTAKA